MEFKEIVLSELAEITMGQSPKSEFYNEIYGMPFLQGNRTFGHLYPTIDTYTEKVTKMAAKGDILMSVRAPVGDLNIAPVDLCIGRGLSAISVNKSLRGFIYYLLKNEIRNLENQSTGTIFSSINKKTLEQLKVSVPANSKDQEKIGDFLWSIDEKIEINNQIIANLEELSQTLFKRWFVDFEFPDENGNPYKSSGGELLKNDSGEMPHAWSEGKIEQVGSIYGGGTPSKKISEYYTNGDISWITPKDLSLDKSIFIYKGQNNITELGLQKSSARLLPKNTILFSSRAPIGYIAIAGQEVSTNQGFKSIVPSKGIGSYYIYFLLKHKLSAIEQAAGGSTFKEISGKGLKNIEIILPNKTLIKKFNKVVENYFDKIKSLERETKYLTKLRDTLLPKLMSGEIELPDDSEVSEHEKLLQ